MECDRFVARTLRVVSRVDTKDYPESVWTLPPTYRLKDQDREKYSEIGECDRFVLKFLKPADAK